MKKPFLLFILLLAFGITIKAQSPLQFNYQAVARDNRGLPLSERDIRIRFSIRDESENGPVEYMEIRKIHTNQFGMFSVGIGSEGAFFTTGSLKEVKWQTGRKFLQAEMDHKGGNNYVNLGSTQLVSVPYAFFALSSMDIIGGQGTFAGASGNGLSIEDSTVMLGNAEGSNAAALTSNRIIPLNGMKLTYQDNVSKVAIAKESITIQQDSAFLPDSKASGGSFLRVDPIFPRADAVPFLFNRAAFEQHNGSVSPNEVVGWGHNLHGGGGALLAGLPGIGYSLESNYKPTPDARWVESHEFYVTPSGKQVRLKSYTIDTKSDWVDFFHSIDNLYIKNPRTGNIYFRVDNFGDDQATSTQQLSLGLLKMDIVNANKEFHFKSTLPNSDLHMNDNWNMVFLPGMLLQKHGPSLLQNDLVPAADNLQNLGGLSNRFGNVHSLQFNGERLFLQHGWTPSQNISPTSMIDITGQQGFNQFRMRKTYTPTSTTDTNGNVGDMAWDENYIYIKTAAGWKRTGLQSF